MKKTMRSLLAFSLVLCMLSAMLVGCAPKTPETPAPTVESTNTPAVKEEPKDSAETTEPEGIDTSEKVELVFYLLGDPPADMQKVEDKINELMLEKINATISFRFTTWTDYVTKYKMILSSNEDCDLIYVADWLSYAQLSRDGAFLPLDELLDTSMPKVKAMADELRWNQMRVDGNIYGVPAMASAYAGMGVVYRKDLMEKYDLPVPDSLENIETFAKGIQENEPNQNIFSSLMTATANYNYPFGMANWMEYRADANLVLPYGLKYDYNNPENVIDYWDSEQFREDMKLLKSWADQGFWPKNVLSYVKEGDITNGGDVLAWTNPTDYIKKKAVAAQNNPEWELGYVSIYDVRGIAFATAPTVDGTAIPLNCKNPERAAMALELLFTDEAIHNLITYGIEGEHYTVEDGYYTPGPANSNYIYEAASTWNLKNAQIDLKQKGDDEKLEIFARFAEIAATTNTPNVDITAGFVEDDSAYSAEKAALLSVVVEYLTPIQAGMVEDVDAAIDTFLAQAEAVGLSEIQEAYSAQWKAYIEANGY